ncbi:branched-chain amino acid ABC transporter permease [Desulfocicer niacini]
MINAQGITSFSSRFGEYCKTASGMTIIFAIIVAALATMHSGSYILLNTVVTGGMWALVGMGLALVFGVMNISSFAHGEFFMIGSLLAYYVYSPFVDTVLDNPDTFFAAVMPLVAMTAALIMGGIAGILTEYLVFRPMRRRSKKDWLMNSFVLTLGVSVLLINCHQVFFGAEFRGIVKYWNYPSVEILGTYVSFDRLMVFFIAMFMILAFWILMSRTKVGRAIRAVSQSEPGAMIVGVDIDGIQSLTMALSCGMAALAGAALLFMYPAYPTVGMGPLYNSWFIVIIAGMGNVAGAAVGGFMIALLQVLTITYIGEGWDYTVPVAFLMVLMIFKPTGLFGTVIRGKLEE